MTTPDPTPASVPHTHGGEHWHGSVGGAVGGLKASATKKIGPLPAWGWAAIVVGLYVGYKIYSSRKASSAAASTPAAATSAFTGDTGTDSTDGGDTTDDSDDGSTTAQVPNADTDNAEWGESVVNWLIGKGVSATDASNAVDAYLNGDKVSPSEELLLNEALAQFGPPPSGVLPITTTTSTTTTKSSSGGTTVKKAPTPAKGVTKPKPKPKPVTKPKTTPKPKTTTYVVKSGDNLSAIASRYGTTWQKIYAANKSTIGGNPNLIKPGQKLVIP